MERFIQANVFVSRRAMADVMAGQRAVGFLHMYIHVASVAGGPRAASGERRASMAHAWRGAACVWPSQPEAHPRGLFDRLRPQRHSHSFNRLIEIFNEGGDFAPRRVDKETYVYDIQLVGTVYNFNSISKSCASLTHVLLLHNP